MQALRNPVVHYSHHALQLHVLPGPVIVAVVDCILESRGIGSICQSKLSAGVGFIAPTLRAIADTLHISGSSLQPYICLGRPFDCLAGSSCWLS